MAEQQLTKTFVIIEIDHESHDSNVAAPLGEYKPVGKILYLHNSKDKAENKLIAILNTFKNSMDHKYLLEYKAPTIVEVKRVDEGWLSTAKIRTRTIQLCEHAY